MNDIHGVKVERLLHMGLLSAVLLGAPAVSQEADELELTVASEDVALAGPLMFVAEARLQRTPGAAAQNIVGAVAAGVKPESARRLLRCLSRLPTDDVMDACPALVVLLRDSTLSVDVRIEVLHALASLAPLCGGSLRERKDDVGRAIGSLLVNAKRAKWPRIAFEKSRLEVFLDMHASDKAPREWLEEGRGLSFREYVALALGYQENIEKDKFVVLESLLDREELREVVGQMVPPGALPELREKSVRIVRLAAARVLVKRSGSAPVPDAWCVLLSEGDRFDVYDALNSMREVSGRVPDSAFARISAGLSGCVRRRDEIGERLTAEAIEVAMVFGVACIKNMESVLRAIEEPEDDDVSKRVAYTARRALEYLNAAERRR